MDDTYFLFNFYSWTFKSPQWLVIDKNKREHLENKVDIKDMKDIKISQDIYSNKL